ncbi:MAG TPA: LysR substrate-binding domain-containing protein [Azospira sp.]|nr:LysR substrate-binding domain-containing protein [Azospira sp.]
MTTPPLNAIRVFVVAARHASFKDAAAELCVTPGAVSRQVQGLEEHLGVPLFERRHRAIALTQLGQLFLAQVAPALAAIDAASDRVRRLARGAVRVDATPTFALHWLIPRLAEFRAEHPQVEVRLGTSQGPVQRSGAVDLHIRRDPAHFGGLPGEPFMTERATLVCSPRLAGRSGWRAPADLLAAPLVRMRSRPDLWPKWFARAGLGDTSAAHVIEFDNTILAIQAAVEGLGVALVPRLFVDGLLLGGALVEVPLAAPFESGAYHLLYERDAATEAAQVFADWLRGRAVGV